MLLLEVDEFTMTFRIEVPESMKLPEPQKAAVAVSGNAKSAVLASIFVAQGYDCTLVHCHIEGKIREIDFVIKLGENLNVPVEILELPPIPLDFDVILTNVKLFAMSNDFDVVTFGVCLPPNHQDILQQVRHVESYEDIAGKELEILMPYAYLTEGQVYTMALNLGIDISFSVCERFLTKACGECDSCVRQQRSLRFAAHELDLSPSDLPRISYEIPMDEAVLDGWLEQELQRVITIRTS